MNFSGVIKNEILNKPIKENHCKKAFLAGLIRGSGALYQTEDGRLGLDFTVHSEDIAYTVAKYFEILFNYELREGSVSEDRLNKKDKFTLTISGEKATEILSELGILIEIDGETAVNLKLYGDITERECCLKWFIKGLFLATGTCTVPSHADSKNTGYHLEMVFSHYTPALETSEKLASFGVMTKITRRKESYIVYIKSAEEIKNFTAFLQTPVSVLKLTDLMINRELVNNTNRRKNCDLGNLNRQVEAVAKQTDAIKKIQATIGLDSLKKDLLETANARLNNPDETLSELAEILGVTKSCLNHRLRKLVAIADEI